MALRDAWKVFQKSDVNYQWIADRVTVKTEDARKVEHPTRNSIRTFFERVDADPKWFPGKSCQKRLGPKPLLTPARWRTPRRTVADSGGHRRLRKKL